MVEKKYTVIGVKLCSHIKWSKNLIYFQLKWVEREKQKSFLFYLVEIEQN